MSLNKRLGVEKYEIYQQQNLEEQAGDDHVTWQVGWAANTNKLLARDPPKPEVEYAVECRAQKSVAGQTFDTVVLRDQWELGDHRECVHVDGCGPDDISPCAEIFARVDEDRQSEARGQAGQDREGLVSDGGIVTRFEDQNLVLISMT